MSLLPFVVNNQPSVIEPGTPEHYVYVIGRGWIPLIALLEEKGLFKIEDYE